MNDVQALPPPTRQTQNYPLTVAAVRHVVLEPNTPNARVLLYAADVIQVLNLDPDDLGWIDDANGGHVTVYEDQTLTQPLLLTVEAVRQLAHPEHNPEGARFVTWVETELSPKKPAHRAPNPNRTRWGWQPIRDLVRQRGYTAREFTEAANALELPGIDHFNQGNYVAWAYGGCLPAESLVERACALLGVQPIELFTEDVLQAYPDRGKGRRSRFGGDR
jgi:hypothetical protein